MSLSLITGQPLSPLSSTLWTLGLISDDPLSHSTAYTQAVRVHRARCSVQWRTPPDLIFVGENLFRKGRLTKRKRTIRGRSRIAQGDGLGCSRFSTLSPGLRVRRRKR